MGCASSKSDNLSATHTSRKRKSFSLSNGNNSPLPSGTKEWDSIARDATISRQIDEHTLKGNSLGEVPAHPPGSNKQDIVPDPTVSKDVDEHAVKAKSLGEVPAHPPGTNKRDIVPDPSIFKHVDEHALQASSSHRTSISELASYLVKPAKSDLEMVRAFYRWITDNIRYDTEGFFHGQRSSCKPGDVLKTGKSVCQGYADLFSALCVEMNIPVKTISGYAKGYGYNAEIVIDHNTDTNHAWNVVLINGVWRFMECTWGAGHVSVEKQFIKEFSEIYFLTDPKDFIINHYPCRAKNETLDAKWQLLEQPVSLKEFSTRVRLDTAAIELGVIPVSHTSGVIEVQSDETIVIKDGQENVENWMMTFSLVNGTDMGKYAMSFMKDPVTLHITVRPPSAEKYVLKIFAKRTGEQRTEYSSILEYIIKCSNPGNSVTPYPSRKTPWAYFPEYKQYGFKEKLVKSPVFTVQNGSLTIEIPTTRQVHAIAQLKHAESRDANLENCTMIESYATKLVVNARLPVEGFYALDIMAKRPWEGDDRYWSSVSYLIDCRKSMSPFNPFPLCYNDAITKYNCRLLEPLQGTLPARSSITFRIESTLLQRIRILDTNLNKNENAIFEGKIGIPDTGTITVYGSENESGSLNGLYRFSIST